jgi:DNA repair ATPase RecN
MTKPSVDTLIWRAISEFSEFDKFLTFEQRSKLSVAINEILKEDQQSTPDFDRLATLEVRVQDVLARDYNVHKVEILEVREQVTNLHATVDTHTAKIVELTEQVKDLSGLVELMEEDHTRLRKCIEEFATNVYQKLM